jgi:hypothetical protein
MAIGAQTVHTLISEGLFNKRGRWYLLDDGPCYIYLENPQTRLEEGRLLLTAHLSSRIGVHVGDNCLGTGFASNATISGRPVGKGSTLTIDDIRIDHVNDGSARDVFDLIQGVAPQALPHALNVDVLSYVRGTPMEASGIPVSLKEFRITDVVTHPDAILVHFNLSLTTP